MFEYTTEDLGSQATVCGGGRYDGLVAEMGGQPTPALGFGMGLERLLLLMEAQGIAFPPARPCDLYIGSIGEAARRKAFALAGAMRQSGVAATFDEVGRGVKAQMKYADKIGARFSMVLGDDELAAGKAQIKNMQTGEKHEIVLDETFAKQFAAIDSSLLS